MKTLKDLTIEDVQALNDAMHDDSETVIRFEVDGYNVDIFTEEMDLGQGLTGYYTIEFNTNGEATADYGDANPVEAGLDFYVEMKRRGFPVPALDEVYGNLHEQINTLEGALAYSDGVFKTMVENEGKRIEEQLQQRDERITELEYELETANEEIADLVHQIDELGE